MDNNKKYFNVDKREIKKIMDKLEERNIRINSYINIIDENINNINNDINKINDNIR